MKNKNKLLNAIKENNLMVALNTYHRAMAGLNRINMHWLDLLCRENSDDDLKFLDKKFYKHKEAAYGSLIDALSHLGYLYETNSLTTAGKSVVKGEFKFCMSKKDLRPIIKRACKKDKKCSINKLYKKYKNKVKVEK